MTKPINPYDCYTVKFINKVLRAYREWGGSPDKPTARAVACRCAARELHLTARTVRMIIDHNEGLGPWAN